jgi:pantoate--beta-alanine ligase
MIAYTFRMQIATTITELRAALSTAAHRSIGLVPTMGALHAGHLSLVDASRAENDFTVATIFVNPTQFAAGEDLAKYPRPIDADLQQLAARGVNLAFTPREAEMYSASHTTFVDVGQIASPLEGVHRPTHYRGVATIVLKLFHLIPASRAYFGQKDYQQSLVVRRMAADLNVPIEIRVCPTVREPDGLAMSSRNAYLAPEDRQRATAIWQALCTARSAVAAGERDAATIQLAMRKRLNEAGITEIDYAALVDAQTLEPISAIAGNAIALIAARVGSTRLIDNELLFEA